MNKNIRIKSRIFVTCIMSSAVLILGGCNTSNEEGLPSDIQTTIQTPLTCRFPDTIKADSFGVPILDENNLKSCERVELACENASYDAASHSCLPKARHPLAPLEVADAIPPDGDWATIFYWRDEFAELDPQKLVSPAAGEATWVAHAWNESICNAYDPDYQEPGVHNDYDQPVFWDTVWGIGLKPDGFDPNYGLYWKFKLVTDVDDAGNARRTNCVNFIVYERIESLRGHSGDIQGAIGNDPAVRLYNPDNMLYIHNELTTPLTGASINPYYTPPGEVATSVRKVDAKPYAHWIDQSTIVLDDALMTNTDGLIINSIRLYHGAGDMRFFPDEGYRGVDYVEFSRNVSGLNPEQSASAHAAKGFSAFSSNAEIPAELAKTMLQGSLAVVAYNSDGEMVAATGVQQARVIDALYTQGENDANEADLGVIYQNGMIKNVLWAPTAEKVSVKLYDAADVNGVYALLSTEEMSFDSNTGTWNYEAPEADLDQKLFKYEVQVFHYQTGKFETLEVVDPYSVSVTTDTQYSRYVNLDDASLKPADWAPMVSGNNSQPEDYVIYAGHIRDFSVLDESTTPEHRGKFLAFTDATSAPVQHLQALAEAGVTHVQLMPINDNAILPERPSAAVNLGNTVDELCNKSPGAVICQTYGDDSSEVIGDILAGLDAYSPESRQILAELANIDSYDWGYNAYLFNTAEGSYATKPEDTSRISELRAMVQALHNQGLKVALDVDFSHTNGSGLSETSVLDQVVPGYFQRRDASTGRVLDSSCCEDTAPENAMMTKLITDTLVTYSQQFNIDAFHITAINNLPRDNLLAIRDAVQQLNSDTYFYGTQWQTAIDFFTPANAANLTSTQVGTVSNTMRDALSSAAFFNSSQFIDDLDKLRISMVAGIANYALQDQMGNITQAKDFAFGSVTQDPAEVINSVASPDTETLFDAMQYNLPSTFLPEQRVRAQQVSLSIPLLSQGIPAIQMGSDLLRSKSMSNNSKSDGDWINRVDFTQQSNNWNVALPTSLRDADKAQQLLMDSAIQVYPDNIASSAELFKEFLQIRRSSPLFRLHTGDDIIDRVGFHNTGQDKLHNMLVMSIDDGAGCINSKLNYQGSCDADEQRPDLDPNIDAVLVVVNGAQAQQSFSMTNITGFELHSTQQSSYDAATRSAYYEATNFGGRFVVPALTTAVFVKPQLAAQGQGINAYASVGQPAVTPYNNQTIYLHTDRGDGADALAFEYLGDGIYEVSVSLTSGSYDFTIGDLDQNDFNVGGGNTIELDTEQVIGQSSMANTIEISASGTYTFTLNALTPDMPSLVVKGGSLLPTYGSTELLIRGDFNGWSEGNPMIYVGNNTYVGTANITETGNFYFKFANAAWNFRIGAEGITGLNVPTPMSILTDAYDPAPTLQITQTGLYLFTINASNPEAPVITISHDVAPYAGIPLYLRGFDSVWDATRPLVYFGDGYYGIDILASQNEDLSFNKYFKIASEAWSNPNSGGASVILDGGFVPTQTVDDAITLDLAAETQLRIIYHVIDDVSNQGEIAVQAVVTE
ncbi:alpha-1,6-glucosidase domain-containing protein [Paraglaciecola sp.]|uniref:alpha-1,6-glucosidase domain-containing protein n=1 Tax=Paraglaciecola sp. TaxID=1920173 RepID=UPI00273F7259|nr:alpha-1,6-glucosidase domain-containing protein [Paraglaciecola sp.]MDP5032586.1 DUF3372 domain-containing protein [Paraglaciecola sp.]